MLVSLLRERTFTVLENLGLRPSLRQSLKRLVASGVNIQTAADIGANTGQWFLEFRHHYPRADVLSIEANPEIMGSLRAVNPNSLNECLFSREGDIVDFHLPNPEITTHNTGASIYREDQPAYDKPRVIRMRTTTLDSLGRTFDYVKLDVQGAELDVLKGGPKTLAQTKVIQLELSILQYNDKAPLAAEVVSFLYHAGFLMLDVTEVNVRGGHPFQFDCLFVSHALMHLVRFRPKAARR
jgi:hypothetical protein